MLRGISAFPEQENEYNRTDMNVQGKHLAFERKNIYIGTNYGIQF